MVEKNLWVDGLEIKYEGLFDMQGLLDKINEVIKESGYNRVEKERSQKVSEKGKELFFELKPNKVPHPYHTLIIKIRIYGHNLEEVEVKVGNRTRKLEKGNVRIIVDGWEFTDYEKRWENMSAWYTLASYIIDRFFYKFMGKYAGMIIGDSHNMHYQLKSYLELHKYAIENHHI